MGFLDKAMEAANAFSKEISSRARVVSSISKLQSQVASEEQKIKNTYSQIGMLYYEANKGKADAEFAEQCSQITTSGELIDSLKKEIEKLKGLQRCPNCGAVVSINSAFCSSCGTRLPNRAATEEPGVDAQADAGAESKAETGADAGEEIKEAAAEVTENAEEKM